MAALRARRWELEAEWGGLVFSLLPTDWERVQAIEAEIEGIKQQLEGKA